MAIRELGELGSWQRESGNLQADQLREAIAGSGKDFVEYDPVGLPDDVDRQNIVNIIRNFERAQPGVISAFAAQARRERDEQPVTFLRPDMKNEVRRRVLTMPTGLLRQIEESYPLMFRNKKHLAWFKANFPIFSVRNK